MVYTKSTRKYSNLEFLVVEYSRNDGEEVAPPLMLELRSVVLHDVEHDVQGASADIELATENDS